MACRQRLLKLLIMRTTVLVRIQASHECVSSRTLLLSITFVRCFYVAQYPVNLNDQYALHFFTPSSGRSVDSDTNSTSLGSILAITAQRIFTGASWIEQKCQSFEMGIRSQAFSIESLAEQQCAPSSQHSLAILPSPDIHAI